MSSFDLEPGSTLSHFRLEKILGEGGMGAVYLAEDLTLSRRVAVKFMKRSLLAQNVKEDVRQGIEQRFIREAKTAAAINHPNLAQIYEANFDSDNWFIAMEFIDGTSIQEMLEDEGRSFSPEEIVSISRQVVSGLKHAWDDYKIIHRDIKTANIMLARGDIVKIVDLGLAKPMSEQEEEMADITGAGVPIGTPQYMAPEQATGQTDLDYRVDIFALGATLYELCTAKKAFSGKTAPLIYMAQMAKKYTPIRETRNDIPRPYIDLIDKMLEPKVKDRIGTYDEILAALNGLGGGPGATGGATIMSRTQTRLSTVFGLSEIHNEFYPTDFLIADRYRVLQALGKSRAGFVYRCIDKELGVECAVKSLFPGREFPAGDMPRIKRNLQRLLQVSHPNLVQIRDLREDEDTGELFVVMELLSGRNLREFTHQLVTEHGDLSVELIQPVLQRVAQAVDNVNEAVGFAHQDLKPESIYLTNGDAEVKLIDYGMVEVDLPDPNQTTAGEALEFEVPLSSPDYMAPELWRREEPSVRTDEYSLGVIVYEMLSHKLPFWLRDQADDLDRDGDTSVAEVQGEMYKRLRDRVLNEPPPPVEGLAHKPQRAIAEALAKSPSERHADCNSLVAGLSGGVPKPLLIVALAVLAGGLAVAALWPTALQTSTTDAGGPDPHQRRTPARQPAGGSDDGRTTLPAAAHPNTTAQPAGGNGQTPPQTDHQDAGDAAQPPETVTADAGGTRSARVAIDPAEAARQEMQKRLQLKKAEKEARRLQETLTRTMEELGANPRADEFKDQLQALAKPAAEAFRNQDYLASIKASKAAIDFAHDITTQLNELMKDEAANLKQQVEELVKKLAPYQGADTTIAERLVKCEVILALARNAYDQQEFLKSIEHYQKVLDDGQGVLKYAVEKFTPVPGKPFTLLKTGTDFVWLAVLKGWVEKYEVTNGEYRRFKPAHDSKKEEGFTLNGDRQPAVELSYYDAIAYCQWLNIMAEADGSLPKGFEFRLPTKMEWLTIARSGTQRAFPWGDDWPPKYGNFGNQEVFPENWQLTGYADDYPVTCPVEKSGRNAWGLYGLSGNVWEWTTDLKNGRRAVLGGGWTSCNKKELACTPKGNIYAPMDTPFDNIGFRVFLAPKPVAP